MVVKDLQGMHEEMIMEMNGINVCLDIVYC